MSAVHPLLQQAHSSLIGEDFSKAQECLEQLLRQFPRHPQAIMLRGCLRVQLNDFEKAIEDWEYARELDPQLQRQFDGPEFKQALEVSTKLIKQRINLEPTNTTWQILLGKTYAALGRYAQALQIFSSTLRNDPEAIEAGYGCAQVYFRLGQGEQALAVLQKLAEQNPDNAELCYKLGKYYINTNSVVQATRYFERASALDAGHWHSHLELGQIFLRQGRHEQAIARFQKTLQLEHNCAAALVGLAECCKELYRFEAAISYYQQAVAADPLDYKALCQMGSLCIQLGGLDLGIETLQRALEINNHDVEIFSSLAKAYQQKGDLATAAQYYAKTVELNPKDYFAAYNLGLIYRSQGQIQSAAELFNRAAQLRPNDSQYQYQSSRSLLELGQVKQALEAAKKAVTLNPHSKESQLLFGRCCLEAGHHQQAAEAFRQAVSIDAQNVEAHYQLAVALLNLGQIDEARNNFQTVLRLSPQHAPSQLGLGHVARQTGQWQTAADHYRQAIQIDLSLRPAIQDLTRLYLERNQKDSINEFVRQICLSRKGDRRIPAEFLRDWLEALESNQQYDLAEEALDFILNVYPTSPQARDNQRQFHLRAAHYFLDKSNREKSQIHIEHLRKFHPQDPALLELVQLMTDPGPQYPPVTTSVQSGEFLQVDTDFTETKITLLSPPPLDTLEQTQPSKVTDEISHPESTERDSAHTSTLLPPPMDEFPDTDLPLQESWQSATISRLALEDMSAGLNPLENLTNLGQHYLRLALDLEKAGWFKQAAIFLADARNFCPDDVGIAHHQLRVINSWAKRLESEGDRERSGQLCSWLEPLQQYLSKSSPPPIEAETITISEATASALEVDPTVAVSVEATIPVIKISPPPISLRPKSSSGLQLLDTEAVIASDSEVSSQQPEPVSPSTADVPVLDLDVPPPLSPITTLEATPEPAAILQDSKTEDAKTEDTKNQIVEWMMSFQEPPVVEAPPQPPPAVEEDLHQPYKSAEFDAIVLTGSETTAELVELLGRYPDDQRIRLALLQAFDDDVPGLLKVFREFTLEAPDEPYHILNLARAYAHTGSDSLAVLQYRKYVKMEPTSEGYQELGKTYERMGKGELASQAMKRAEQLAEREAD